MEEIFMNKTKITRQSHSLSLQHIFGIVAFLIILTGISISAFHRIQAANTTTGGTTTGTTTPTTPPTIPKNYHLAATSTSGAISAYIDWDEQDLMIVSTLQDEYFYISDAKMKTWDEITAVKGIAYCDLSWINKEYELNIRGDKNLSDIIKVSIAAPRTLKAKFAITNEAPTITLTMTEKVGKQKISTQINPATTAGVQWRKSTAGEWHDYKTLDLSSFLTKGATLNIRLTGSYNADATKCYLPSKVASVKVTKKANAPSVKVDCSKLTLGVKKGQEYIVSTPTTKTAIYNISDAKLATPALSTIAAGALNGNGYSTPFSSFSIKVRTASTAKKAASKWTVLSYPAQRTPSENSLTAALSGTVGATLTNATTYNIEYYIAPNDLIQTVQAAEFGPKTKWSTIKAGKTATYKPKATAAPVTSSTAIFFRYAAEKDNTKTPENEAQIASTVVMTHVK